MIEFLSYYLAIGAALTAYILLNGGLKQFGNIIVLAIILAVLLWPALFKLKIEKK